MAYNTQLENLIMPEYGRNVQQLVRHAQRIENDDERQAFCEEIVSLIQQLYPQSKSIDDYREKLWKHLFHIARYDLTAKTPSGEVPTPENARKKPSPVPYPSIDTRFKHYGSHVQTLIRKALSMEPGPIRDGFITTIGSYMKMAYRTWNREHFVSDEIIKTDLLALSNGKIALEEDTRIDGLSNASRNRVGLSNANNGSGKDKDRDRNKNQQNQGRRDNKNDSRDSRDNRNGNNHNRNNNNNHNNHNKKKK